MGSTDVSPVGLLLLDTKYPSVAPGTPGYVDAADAGVRCRKVDGCTVDRLIYEADEGLAEPMVAAARELVAEGARAIMGNCGFMIRHQAAVSNAVDVPVFLSSLLFAPLLLAGMGSTRKLGIVTASRESLTSDVLDQMSVGDPHRVVVGDLEHQPVFRAAHLDCTEDGDSDTIEREILDVTAALVDENPDIAMVLLECTVLPPFVEAIQRKIGMPVFDSARLIDLVATGFAPHPVQRLVHNGLGVVWLPSWRSV